MVVPDGVVRVTVALSPVDVDLLDRAAALDGTNRSALLRSMVVQFRPMLRALVESLEAAAKVREEMDSVASVTGAGTELEELLPEMNQLQERMLGTLARLESSAAAEMARGTVPDDEDAQAE